MTICLQLGLDLTTAYKEKMAISEQRYPVHLAKGSNKKWTHYVGASETKSELHNSVGANNGSPC